MRTLTLSLFLVLWATAPAAGQDSFGGPPPKDPPRLPPPAAGPPPANAGQPGAVDLDRLMTAERQDYGVAPTNALHTGGMHGPTPTSIPGGQVITTKGLVALMANQQVRAVVLDILGGPESIPGALAASPAAQAGSFTDQTQQEFGQFLEQMTQGNKETPIVLYCLSTQCWMSYNASLRAINMGYKNVLWYRGGIEAWKAGGQPVQKH
jgi:PQQ-dependent catabolism-associated CXXCW motif protein